MGQEEEEKPRPTQSYALGQPLDLLSVAEIDQRIAELRAEITRLEAARTQKQAAQSAAEAFFKK